VTSKSLLPPNSSVTERALETALLPGLDVLTGVSAVRTAKEDVPDGWPYWLVWEYGLEELLPYLADPRVVLSEGLRWQRVKGTPQSLHIAHGWIGLPDAYIEEQSATSRHWFEYQLDPGRIPNPIELSNLVGLSRLSAPVGTRLSRVYHGLDLRRAIYDETRWSDGSLYSSESGVWDPDLGVILSFGQTHQSVCTITVLDGVTIILIHNRAYSSTTWYLDRLLWDNVSWSGDDPIRNYVIDHEREIDTITPGVGRNILIADGGMAGVIAVMLANGQWTAGGGQIAAGVGTFQPQVANGQFTANGKRAELPQYPVDHVTQDYTTQALGWGAVPWGARTWTQPA